MYNMLNFIPDDMGEVQQKLFWLKANGYTYATEQEVIEKTILDGVQYMFDDALEGPYWTVIWDDTNKKLAVRGATSEIVGYIIPRENHSTFSDDFKEASPLTWENLSKQVEKLIGSD